MVAEGEARMVDLAFPLRGEAIAADYAWRLWLGVRERLPWLEEEVEAGVHPLSGLSGNGDTMYLSRRARLVLRIPARQIDAAQALTGMKVDLGGEVVVDGEGGTRALQPAPVLYASFVCVDRADEAEFIGECQSRLPEMASRMICGKARSASRDSGVVQGFSLMLHDLDASASLELQCRGLGNERRLGCGIFVPHKSVAAVGT